MAISSLNEVFGRMRALGVTRVLSKPLAENDNSKQQIYLGGNFEALQVLPFGDVTTGGSTGTGTLRAPLDLGWLNTEGKFAPAVQAKLILYPSYPEVRLSGFLAGCPTAPSSNMQPVPRNQRRFNNGPDGRVLLLGITAGNSIVAFLIEPGSVLASEFNSTIKSRLPRTLGVFQQFTISLEDTRSALLEKLRIIHAAGWIDSCRLIADGSMQPYRARNGAGYTLEAKLGITPNARSEPDFEGWELKAYNQSRVTLMTPEPDGGFYGDHGVEAFLRKYGHDSGNDTLYFTGLHRTTKPCEKTGQKLTVSGFDSIKGRITDPEGGVLLVDGHGTVSASWSFSRLLKHWGRKHAAAAYVRYIHRDLNQRLRQYRYSSPAMLGEGTDFVLFLSSLERGSIAYDPGPKLVEASTAKSKVKARSQFRINVRNLPELYSSYGAEPLG